MSRDKGQERCMSRFLKVLEAMRARPSGVSLCEQQGGRAPLPRLRENLAAGRAFQFGLFGRQQGLGTGEGQAKALAAGRVPALGPGQVALWRCEVRPHQDHLDRTQEKHAHSDGRTRVSPR